MKAVRSNSLLRVCRSLQALSCFLGASAFGQAQPAPSADDLEFAALQVAAQPLPIPPPAAGAKKTHDDFVRDQKMQSTAFLAAADQAHAFYTSHPAHAKASAAKKIEVVSLLRASNTGSSEVEPKALRLAREFRSDNSNKSSERFEVAMTVTQMDVSKKHIKEKAALLTEYQQRANDLYGEFPDEPAVYEFFVGIARNSDDAQAQALANQLLRMPAPASVKDEAHTILDRLSMPGKPIQLEWQDENGKLAKIQDYKGKIVVFYVWATWSGAAAATPAQLSSLPANVTLVSVNVDLDLVKGKAAKAKASFGGSAYYDERGLNGPLARQLKAAKVPAVHVVDANGKYVGSGAPSELAALLAQAAK